MKTVFRSFLSVVLGFVLWCFLLFVLGFLCMAIVYYLPSLAKLFVGLLDILHAPQWYAILMTGLPAILPALLLLRIMKSESEKARMAAMISLIVVISLFVLFIMSELSILQRAEGIFGAFLACWVLLKVND